MNPDYYFSSCSSNKIEGTCSSSTHAWSTTGTRNSNAPLLEPSATFLLPLHRHNLQPQQHLPRPAARLATSSYKLLVCPPPTTDRSSSTSPNGLLTTTTSHRLRQPPAHDHDHDLEHHPRLRASHTRRSRKPYCYRHYNYHHHHHDHQDVADVEASAATTMSSYYGGQPNNAYPGGGGAGASGAGPAAAAQNLQFYPSSYSPAVSGAATPQQASYSGYAGGGGAGVGGFTSAPGFGGAGGAGAGVSGRMGEQGGLRTGWLAAFSTEGYDTEPPLLEELGVNFGHIQMKTLAVLNPFKHIDQHLMDDSDLAGPILFFLLFGTFLLFSGKVHFGYIYGLALLGSTSLHMILSLMSPSDPHPGSAQSFHPQYNDPSSQAHHDSPQHQPGGHFSATLTFPRSASVLGYCLLPLVATSLFGIVMPMDTPLGIVLTTAAIMWCTYSASGMFCAVGRMKGMRGLVAYPLALFYVGFGIMGIFSSRGSGSLAKVAAAKVNG
ncbi:hypothetical protein JDV02_008690 [Purpureocillium takamizusanense]|uniref:Yip1 domain-containing protein n=1 Tax=Purpureocillium takamizusanense TaxID=2060973 RepID=A0A9Q8QNE0_9HYPO|nr:uncharacterized protein JDV02_008690 [Purpureocillium takamizusanense]UNI22838.1 hypothetical protein JDV02_008690 [Purpureocillium takamizusanense]